MKEEIDGRLTNIPLHPKPKRLADEDLNDYQDRVEEEDQRNCVLWETAVAPRMKVFMIHLPNTKVHQGMAEGIELVDEETTHMVTFNRLECTIEYLPKGSSYWHKGKV